MTRLGVFGGTFDPIHLGHLAAAEDAAWLLALDAVLFVPNRLPPHKQAQTVSSPENRVAMVELCVRDNPRFQLSLIEMEREGPSYTLDTMRALRGRYGSNTELVFLAGSDALTQLHTWHEPETLLQEFQVVFLRRPLDRPVDWPAWHARFPGLHGRVHVEQIPQLEIASADIRRRVAEGRPIRYYVVPAVEAYIRRHDLYRPGRASSAVVD